MEEVEAIMDEVGKVMKKYLRRSKESEGKLWEK